MRCMSKRTGRVAIAGAGMTSCVCSIFCSRAGSRSAAASLQVILQDVRPPEGTAALAAGHVGCLVRLPSALHVQRSQRLLLRRAVLQLGLLQLLLLLRLTGCALRWPPMGSTVAKSADGHHCSQFTRRDAVRRQIRRARSQSSNHVKDGFEDLLKGVDATGLL